MSRVFTNGHWSPSMKVSLVHQWSLVTSVHQWSLVTLDEGHQLYFTILYKSTKVKGRSPDRDTDYFDIVAGVQQGDTWPLYLFIICLGYVLRTSIDFIKENGYKVAKVRTRRYPTQTITGADYADDIAQAESQQHCLERAAAGRGFHVNAHKTEYMCFNQRGDISTLKGGPLKLVDKFTYRESNVSSTETDINTRLAKAWTAISHMEVRPER